MKTLKPVCLLTVIFLSLSSICSAQAGLAASESSLAKDQQARPTVTATVDAQTKYAHTQLATKQFLSHLTRQIEYPSILQEYGIEGTAVVEVAIASNGMITKTSIVKSFSSEFDRAILKAVKNLKQIKLKESLYQGATRLRVPVQFKLH